MRYGAWPPWASVPPAPSEACFLVLSARSRAVILEHSDGSSFACSSGVCRAFPQPWFLLDLLLFCPPSPAGFPFHFHIFWCPLPPPLLTPSLLFPLWHLRDLLPRLSRLHQKWPPETLGWPWGLTEFLHLELCFSLCSWTWSCTHFLPLAYRLTLGNLFYFCHFLTCKVDSIGALLRGFSAA